MASSPGDYELAYRTAGELASELAQKHVSAVELVDARDRPPKQQTIRRTGSTPLRQLV
jgi:hypothetical protein